MRVAREITDQLAIAVAHSRLLAETQRRATELATLNNAGQAITSTLDLDAVLKQALIEANAMIEAEGTAILLYDPDHDDLVFASAASPGAEQMVGMRVPCEGSIAGWAVVNKQPLLVRDVQDDPRFFSGVDDTTGLTTRSLIAVPLIYLDRMVGVIEAANKARGSFNQHDLELLSALASPTAIAIENARLFEQLRERREQLRQLARQVVVAQEEERQRLSHELHDEAGQMLTALSIQLRLTQSDLPAGADELRSRLGEAAGLAEDTLDMLRSIARDLRPPALETAGLNSTLEGLCHNFAHWIQLSIHYDGAEVNGLSDAANISLYRFLQEALTNIAKHAGATEVWISLDKQEDGISLSVKDDGKGFDPNGVQFKTGPQQGIGLVGMRERLELLGGRVEIEAAAGQGARLTAYLPT
jgi:signal transduction histidine kinase